MEGTKDLCGDAKSIKDSPSSSKDLSKTLPEEAFNNFLQGKRHMLVQDYTFAVQSLATACELYVKHFGELALECGEVYFLYGKALFRLSQQQSGVLGGALNEGSNDEDDEDKSSGEESKGNDSERNNSDTEGGDDNQEEGGGIEGQDAAEVTNEEKEPSESTDSPQAILDEGSTVVKEKADETQTAETEASIQHDSMAEENPQETEEDDLELAWNTLETAKSIFKRQNDTESQLKVAEILQLLAEISMESDNNAAAINDLKECLSIQKEHLSPDNRILAETYYQMGLAQMLDKQYTEALDNFRTTMQILTLRIENLKSHPVHEAVGSFDAADQAIEIADLESILLDIKEKIEDTEELIRNTKKELEEAFSKGSKAVTIHENAGESGSKPISNITHLLKRKKPDEAEKEEESKRMKMSTSVPNGESDASQTTGATGNPENGRKPVMCQGGGHLKWLYHGLESSSNIKIFLSTLLILLHLAVGLCYFHFLTGITSLVHHHQVIWVSMAS